jgi:hypothetical protein
MTIPLVDIQSCRVCVCVYTLYIHTYVQYIDLFLMQQKCKRLTSIVSGTVHSDRTVIVLLHRLPVSDRWHLLQSKHVTLPLILSALSQTVRMLL